MKQKIKDFLKINFPVLRVRRDYKIYFGYSPNLKNPKSFSEKIQYLKLFIFPKSEYIGKLADKYGVRSHVEKVGLEHTLTPLIGAYDMVEEIPFDNLPQSFVAKKSNAAGYNLIVKNKDKIKVEFFRDKLNEFLKKDFGLISGERHYSKGLNKIIIEPFLEIDNDYKFFVFSGKVEICQALNKSFDNAVTAGFEVGGGTNGKGAEYKIYYDRSGNPVFPEKERGDEINLPSKYSEMIKISETLGADLPFVRVDLYLIGEKIYLSEMTFTPASGYNHYFTEEWQEKLGNLLDLSDLAPYFKSHNI